MVISIDVGRKCTRIWKESEPKFKIAAKRFNIQFKEVSNKNENVIGHSNKYVTLNVACSGSVQIAT